MQLPVKPFQLPTQTPAAVHLRLLQADVATVVQLPWAGLAVVLQTPLEQRRVRQSEMAVPRQLPVEMAV